MLLAAYVPLPYAVFLCSSFCPVKFCGLQYQGHHIGVWQLLLLAILTHLELMFLSPGPLIAQVSFAVFHSVTALFPFFSLCRDMFDFWPVQCKKWSIIGDQITFCPSEMCNTDPEASPSFYSIESQHLSFLPSFSYVGFNTNDWGIGICLTRKIIYLSCQSYTDAPGRKQVICIETHIGDASDFLPILHIRTDPHFPPFLVGCNTHMLLTFHFPSSKKKILINLS